MLSQHKQLLVVISFPNDMDKPNWEMLKAAIEKALHRYGGTALTYKVIGPAATPDDLSKAVDKYRPSILHIIAHGNTGLIMSSPKGESQEVPTDAFRKLIQTFDVRIVVMNACYSAEVAKAIQDVVACVIGMKATISYDTAINFASAFYHSISQGSSIGNAYKFGVLALGLGNSEDEPFVEIKFPEGADPNFLQPLWPQIKHSPDLTTFYLKELNQKSAGYRPTWLPGSPVRLGDVGVLDKGVFRKEDTLTHLNIAFTTETSELPSAVDFSSESGITITTKVKDKVEPKAISLGAADAGFIVEFADENGFIFKLRKPRISKIANLGDVEAKVLQLYQAGSWAIPSVIVSEIVEAESSLIMLSGHADNKVEFRVVDHIDIDGLDIADAAPNLRFASGQPLAVQIIGQQSMTALYRVIVIKKKPSLSFEGKDPTAERQEQTEEFEVAEIEMGNSVSQ